MGSITEQWDLSEERISELEDRTTEIIQLEQQRENSRKE